MQLFLLGLNHKTAPVEVREQLALSPSHLRGALRGLREQAGAREVAILSTCNRAEVYAVGEDDAAPRLERFLSEFHHVAQPSLGRHLYRKGNADSARHLFRVASGVDSLVLGESQILGQVKTALEAARSNGALGGVLDELFRRAISCGKRARAETDIGRGALSVGSAAVELARQIFGPLQGRTVLILGAGKMSELTAQHLVASGARSVIVANRTYERACEIATLFDERHCAPESAAGENSLARAVRWDDFPQHLAEADIVISSTRAPHLVLTAEQVNEAMRTRASRKKSEPLLLIDIAVPRDIDPEAHRLDNVFLYDIDDLQGVVQLNRAQRGNELARVEAIVEDEVAAWEGWYRGREAQPLMAALARHADSVRDREVEQALSQLSHLSERERDVVRSLGRSISGKLMHAPLRYLREAGASGSSDVEALRRAFALEDRATSTQKNGAEVSSTDSLERQAAPEEGGA
jgi:glutamyl-tRNA reductase